MLTQRYSSRRQSGVWSWKMALSWICSRRPIRIPLSLHPWKQRSLLPKLRNIHLRIDLRALDAPSARSYLLNTHSGHNTPRPRKRGKIPHTKTTVTLDMAYHSIQAATLYIYHTPNEKRNDRTTKFAFTQRARPIAFFLMTAVVYLLSYRLHGLFHSLCHVHRDS